MGKKIFTVFYTENSIIKKKVFDSEKEAQDFMKTSKEEYFISRQTLNPKK